MAMVFLCVVQLKGHLAFPAHSSKQRRSPKKRKMGGRQRNGEGARQQGVGLQPTITGNSCLIGILPESRSIPHSTIETVCFTPLRRHTSAQLRIITQAVHGRKGTTNVNHACLVAVAASLGTPPPQLTPSHPSHTQRRAGWVWPLRP